MYEEGYKNIVNFDFPESVSATDRSAVIKAFVASYSFSDNKDLWFGKCKELAAKLGFATDMKEFKRIQPVLRVALVMLQQSYVWR